MAQVATAQARSKETIPIFGTDITERIDHVIQDLSVNLAEADIDELGVTSIPREINGYW